LATKTQIPTLIERDEAALLNSWVEQQLSSVTRRRDLLSDTQVRSSSQKFLRELRQALQYGTVDNFLTPAWDGIRSLLEEVSRTRVQQGFTPSETATFVFSFKQPLFELLRQTYGKDPEALASEIWVATTTLDRLGLFTTETFQRSREEIVQRQQQEMLELSTPVVTLWEDILALPLIGTLDSARTQIVMQNLLEGIVTHRAAIAIIDITGVPTVDTLVAQHLLKTVAAARLMGAECIISGIRPPIAQTIIHLGVDLAGVITKATLADAFKLALRRLGHKISSGHTRAEGE
jgi:rsbT co-antagonist protein RsbR